MLKSAVMSKEKSLVNQTEGLLLPDIIAVVDRRRFLPDDANEIAAMCSDGLALPSLQEPFLRFLLAAGDIEDLTALGIAFSRVLSARNPKSLDRSWTMRMASCRNVVWDF